MASIEAPHIKKNKKFEHVVVLGAYEEYCDSDMDDTEMGATTVGQFNAAKRMNSTCILLLDEVMVKGVASTKNLEM